MYGHDPSHTANNPAETTINIDNIGSLVQRWQVYIGIDGGPAFSAPSVAGGKVYVAAHVPSGDNFFGFDATTGRYAWSANIGHGAESCFGVGIGSTPAISGTLIAVGGGDSAYYGLDAITGAQLWRHPLNAGPSAFPWTSPLISQGRVYVGLASDCDNPSIRGEVRALDAGNGSMLANQYFVPEGQAGAGIWNSPALSPDGSTLVVTTGEDFGGYNGPYNRAIVSLDPSTLQIFQSNQQGETNEDQDWNSSPIFFHDAANRSLVGANHKDGTFYAYATGSIDQGPIWHVLTSAPTGSTAAYDPSIGDGGTLFLPAAQGQLFAIDPATGARRWSISGLGLPGDGLASADGLLYMNVNGSITVLDEHDGHTVRTLQPSGESGALAGPVVSNGFVYWTSGGNLNAWSLPATPTPTPTPGSCSASFDDVGPGDYFHDAVSYLYCRGAISGYGDNTFRPYNDTTRGQLTKIVVLAEGWDIDVTGGPHFTDVPPDNPFYPYIETAYRRGIISGYSDGTFRWGSNITRGQLCRMVTLAERWPIDLDGGPHFSDVPTSAPFYAYIETAYNHGSITGYADGTFHPAAPATRGQISKIVYGVVVLR